MLQLHPKVIKHCPQGHEMKMSWRTCPRCTGAAPESSGTGREISDATVMVDRRLSPSAEARVGPTAPAVASAPVAGPAPIRFAPASDRPPAVAVQPVPAPVAPSPVPGASSEPCLARLIAGEGVAGARVIEVRAGLTKIGKAPREDGEATLIVLPDNFLSRDHALLEADATSVALHDLGSTNGTFVNGDRIESVVLRDGDEVRFGATVFRVEVAPGAPGR